MYKLQFCTFIFTVSLQFWTMLVILVYTFVLVSELFLLVPLFGLFVDKLRYVSHLHSVCTISAILYFFVPFVQGGPAKVKPTYIFLITFGT